ncbi:hypothetical protein B0O99DRAFT_80484 [Bisporella sp. PMI_857]|nr:hypothetical protein B0O99DRAFT_80484 [Bisporella sp. PMI_857]
MVVGDVIDYDSSAYDTQDAAEPGEFYEEYLRGSDIDDEEIEELSTIEDMQPMSDVEMTASQQALELEAEINDLVAEDNSEGSESDDQVQDNIDGVEMEENEASLVMVDKPSGPNSDEMQDYSGPRLQRARDDVGAAKAVGGQNWHNASLLSITADHTHPEREL